MIKFPSKTVLSLNEGERIKCDRLKRDIIYYKQNIRKHKLNFRLASTVFYDPYQLTLYDEEHSQDEDRWITIGLDETGILRVIVHTFEQIEQDFCLIRIISARQATFHEQQDYQRRKL